MRTVDTNIIFDCCFNGKSIPASFALVLTFAFIVVVNIFFRSTTIRTYTIKCKRFGISSSDRTNILFIDDIFKRKLINYFIFEKRKFINLEISIGNLNILVFRRFQMRDFFFGNRIDIVFKELVEPVNMFRGLIKMIDEINLVQTIRNRVRNLV